SWFFSAWPMRAIPSWSSSTISTSSSVPIGSSISGPMVEAEVASSSPKGRRRMWRGSAIRSPASISHRCSKRAARTDRSTVLRPRANRSPSRDESMPRVFEKQALKRQLLDLLREQLEVLEHAHRTTHAGATHEEAKPENDKDTRALEQSYLARGQANR